MRAQTWAGGGSAVRAKRCASGSSRSHRRSASAKVRGPDDVVVGGTTLAAVANSAGVHSVQQRVPCARRPNSLTTW